MVCSMNAEERRSAYKQLCDQGIVSDLFMQPWWLDATGEWDVVLSMKNGRTVGAFPFGLKKRWGLRFITMPAFTHHLSVWMQKPPDISEHKWLTREKQLIWSLLDELPDHAFFSMVFEESGFTNWLPFYWKGYRQEMRYTSIIYRREDGNYFENVNRNVRRSLKETDDSINIQEGKDVLKFFDLAKETYKRQSIPMPYDFEHFKDLHTAVQDKKCGKIFEATSDSGELLAVAYLVWDKRRAYYLLAGNSEKGNESKAGFAVCAEAIRFSFDDLNVQEFDFCGSMIESISEVRRQFGATSVPLMKIYKARSRWLEILYTLTR